MRRGIFGGCFDPIHHGHIRPAKQAKEALALDEIVFLPTAVPPHKPERQFAPPHSRFAMVELALLHESDLKVSALELTPDRPFYTVDSLRHFHAAQPDAELFLLMGCDSLGELHTWKDWRDICDLARLAVLLRPDWKWERVRQGVPPEIRQLADTDRVEFVDNDPVLVSATDVRDRIAGGEPVSSEEVPELVLEYIRKYDLYR